MGNISFANLIERLFAGHLAGSAVFICIFSVPEEP